MHAKRFVLLAVSLAAAASSTARAETGKTSSLSWVELPGAESCGGAPAIARAVEVHLGRHAIVSPAQADLSIEGRVEHIPGSAHWHSVIVMRDAAGKVLGTRELDSDTRDCAPLRESVALAIGLMIDPDAVLSSRPAAAPAPPPAAPPPPAHPPPPRVIIERVETRVPVYPRPSAVWHVEPSAGAAVAYGVLPLAAVGFRVGVMVVPPWFGAVEVFGGMWAAQTVAADAGLSATLSPVYAGAALCPLRLEGATHVAFTACAGAQVVAVQSTGHGFAPSRDETNVATHLFVSGDVEIPIAGAVRGRVGGQAGAALTRDRFVFSDAAGGTQSLFQPPVLQAGAEAGLMVSLP